MLGIVSDKEFNKEIEKSKKASRVNSIHVNQNESEGEESLINSISSNSIEQTRVEDADGNNSSNNSTTQREALDSNIQSDSFKEPRGNISSNESSEELCGKIVEINKPGRRQGDNNVPESLRKIIGAESIESGRKAGLKLASHVGM